MTARDRCAAFFAALLAAALTAGAAAAGEPAAQPGATVGIADAAAAADTGAGAPPDSRLLRMLSERAAPPASEPPPPEAGVGELDPVGAGMPVNGGPGRSPGPGSSPVPGRSPVFDGCPRALLNALLAGAAETGDAVSALAIERETLSLCRERQQIVNGIVALEGELGALLAEAGGRAAAPVAGAVSSTAADAPIVKESAPVRVVSLPPARDAAEEPTPEAETVPAPPAYSWFSIIGTAGDLRAGIGDGERVWFVREGDSLPGGVLIAGIRSKPPSVHVGGTGEAALPYRPLPMDASPPARGNAAPGGDAAGGGR